MVWLAALECAYRNRERCEGEPWRCPDCNTWYCAAHGHETVKGRNVECRACEEERHARRGVLCAGYPVFHAPAGRLD